VQDSLHPAIFSRLYSHVRLASCLVRASTQLCLAAAANAEEHKAAGQDNIKGGGTVRAERMEGNAQTRRANIECACASTT